MNLKLYLFILISIVLSACMRNEFMDSGPIKSRTYNYSEEVKIIDVNDVFDVYLVNGNDNLITVKGGENIIDDIEFSLNEEGRLAINNDTKYRWSRDFKRLELEIQMSEFHRLQINGSCFIRTRDTLKLNKLVFWFMGDICECDLTVDVNYLSLAPSRTNIGKYKVQGKANVARHWINCSAEVDATQLKTKESVVYHQSIADIRVWATEKMSYSITKSGNLYYYGNPTITLMEKDGSGQLIHLDKTN